MKNNFFYNFSLGNINAKPSNNSETLSQILYGEKFKVLKNQKNWVKIKTNFDNYIGYIKKIILNRNICLMANEQKKGFGRRGTTWESPKNNVYISILYLKIF